VEVTRKHREGRLLDSFSVRLFAGTITITRQIAIFDGQQHDDCELTRSSVDITTEQARALHAELGRILKTAGEQSQPDEAAA